MKELLMKNKYLVGICIVVCVFFGYQWIVGHQDKSSVIELETVDVKEVEEVEVEPVEEKQSIMVDVKGAVNSQGVYELQQGARVKDAINLAGGVTEQADEFQVNYAQIVEDEMLIYVPTVGEVSEVTEAIQATSKSGTININNATVEELQTLTGVGPSKAEAILQYRDDNGGFKTIEDIQNVSGIGEKSFEKIKDEISIK